MNSFRDTRNGVVILFVIAILICFFEVLAFSKYISVITKPATPYMIGQQYYEYISILEFWVKYLKILFLLAFGGWIFISYSNLQFISDRKLYKSQWWALCGFLIPIWNYWHSYKVLTEIWRKSSPSEIAKAKARQYILVWCLLFWGTRAFVGFTLRQLNRAFEGQATAYETDTSIIISIWNQLAFSEPLILLGIIATCYIVYEISHMQFETMLICSQSESNK